MIVFCVPPTTMATAENQKIHTKGFNTLRANPLPMKKKGDGLSSCSSNSSLALCSWRVSLFLAFKKKVIIPNATKMAPAPMQNQGTPELNDTPN